MMPAFEAAIRLQHDRLRERLAAGMPRAGWKICVNDRRMQGKLGLAGSFTGFLDGARQLASGQSWPAQPGSILGVEPEIAVHFRRAPQQESFGSTWNDQSREAMALAIAGIAPAIEIVEWQGAKFDLGSLAASSSFHAGFVVGELSPLAAVPAIGEGCPSFRRGDEIIGVPDPELMPGDVVAIAQQVAAFLAPFAQRIEAGDWLLCGACTNPARALPGDEVEADFGVLGSVRVRFGE